MLSKVAEIFFVAKKVRYYTFAEDTVARQKITYDPSFPDAEMLAVHCLACLAPNAEHKILPKLTLQLKKKKCAEKSLQTRRKIFQNAEILSSAIRLLSTTKL